MMGNHALLIQTNPSFYADPKVMAMAYSYADLFIFGGKRDTGYGMQNNDPAHLKRLFEGGIAPITGSAVTCMQFGPMDSVNVTQPDGTGTMAGRFATRNHMARMRDVNDVVWVIRPTLVPTKIGQSSECKSAHLVASTTSYLRKSLHLPDTGEKVESVIVPFLSPADGLDLKLFHAYDSRGANTMDVMVSHRAHEREENAKRLGDAKKCIAMRRQGLKRVVAPTTNQSHPRHVTEKHAREFMGMTPRELSTTIGIMERRMAKRIENDKRLIVDMAAQVEAFSTLLVARLPIAYSVLMMQLNQLDYREE